jgi:hypothetical protein
LRRGGVVAGILGQAQREVCLVRVEPFVLQVVRVELVVQADAAALLPQVEQNAAGIGDPFDGLAELTATVTAS